MLGLGLGTSKGGFVDALAEVTNTKSTLFDGSDEYVNFGNQSPIQDIWASGGSVSCWIKPNSLSANNERVLDKKPVGFNGWYISLNNLSGTQCKLTFRSYWSGADYEKRTTNTVIDLGLWNHIAITYNSDTFSNTATIYINGVSVGLTSVQQPTSGNSVGSDSSGDLTAGCQLSSGSPINMFDGNIDEIAMWNDILTAPEVAQIYNSNRGTLDLSTDTFNYSSSANLKAWWRMGDEASTRVADDNANNLVIPDMRKTFFTSKSIDFDGTDDYVKVGSQSFTDDSDFSISLWFKSSDTTKQTPLLTSPVDSTGNWSLKMKTSGKVTFSFSDGSNSINSQDNGLTCSDGQWHHVVITVDRSNGCTHNRYIDGGSPTARGSTAVTGDLNTGNFYYIGATNGSGNQDNFANAQICDVAIFNTVLDADTIASIYNSGEPNNLLLPASYTAGSGVDKTGNLQAYYRMGNGTLDEHPLVADQTDLTLASNIVQNGDFESTIDITSSGFPNHNYVDETSDSGQDLTISTDTSNPRNGSQCMKLTLTGATSGEVNYKIEDIPAGLYKISIFARNGVSQNSAKIRLGGHTLLRSFSSTDSGSIDLTDSYQEIVAYVNFASTTTFFFAIGVNNGTDGHHILVDDFSVQKFNGNAGLMENASAFDIVDHAPNRNSGDMINFDATADIETDTPVQIYTVANTKSVLFDGSNDYINIGSPSTGTGTKTISMWVKANTVTSDDRLISNIDSPNFSIRFGDSNVELWGGSWVSLFANPSASNWTHFAFVFDGSTNVIGYKNGVAGSSVSTNYDFSNLGLGATFQLTHGNHYDGNMDEVAIWDTALTASQVAQIYHGGQANFDLSQNGGGYTSASNLQAWYRMGDGTIDDNNITGNGLIGDQTDTTTTNISLNGNESALANITETTSVSITGNLTAGKAYKLVFTKTDTVNVGYDKWREGGGSYTDIYTTSALGTGTYTIYFIAVESKPLQWFSGGNPPFQGAITNISLEEYNGNAGKMTNMASNAIETDTP